MPMEQEEEKRSTSKKFEAGDIVHHTGWGHSIAYSTGIVVSVIHDGDSVVVLLTCGRFFVDKVENFMVL